MVRVWVHVRAGEGQMVRVWVHARAALLMLPTPLELMLLVLIFLSEKGV